MNWYKKAQISKFPSWLSTELQKINNQISLDENDIKLLENYYNRNYDTINKNDMNILDVLNAAKSDTPNTNQYHPDTIKQNHNEAISNSQNFNPKYPSFMVDLRSKHVKLSPSIKNSISKDLQTLGDYFNDIPIDTIFSILEKYNTIALQEDGTKWSGMLMGNKPCGSEEANKQRVSFQLAHKFTSEYIPTKEALHLAWCGMQSGKVEVIKYIN